MKYCKFFLPAVPVAFIIFMISCTSAPPRTRTLPLAKDSFQQVVSVDNLVPNQAATPVPTIQSSDNNQPDGRWGLVLILILCSMIGLLIIGVGIAILMVRLRERIR